MESCCQGGCSVCKGGSEPGEISTHEVGSAASGNVAGGGGDGEVMPVAAVLGESEGEGRKGVKEETGGRNGAFNGRGALLLFRSSGHAVPYAHAASKVVAPPTKGPRRTDATAGLQLFNANAGAACRL